MVRSGLLDRVKASLEREGISFIELGGCSQTRAGLVYKGIELCRKERPILSCCRRRQRYRLCQGNSGSVPYDGDFWDFYKGSLSLRHCRSDDTDDLGRGQRRLPNSVITNEDGMYKRGAAGEALRPVFSILNPALTQTLPPYQVACGITDMMAHLFERYFTRTSRVEVTDRMIEGLLLAIINEGPRAVKDPADYDAQANLMWAGMMAHNNSCGVGRTQDWASHGMEHELSALYDVPHGAGLAVVFPAWMTFVLERGGVNRLAQLAVRVWGCQMDFENPENTARAGIAALKRFLKSIGMPTNFAELGAREEDIEEMAHKACFGNKGAEQ